MEASAVDMNIPEDGVPEFPEIIFINKRFKISLITKDNCCY